MTDHTLTFDDLRRISRLGDRAQRATVERWLKRSGIAYKYDGRGGVWTTLESVNAALGIGVAGIDAASYGSDILA